MDPVSPSDPRVAQALDDRYARSLPPVLAALCLLFAWQVVTHPFLVPARPGDLLWNAPFAILLTFAAGAAFTWKRPLTRAQASLGFALAALLATANVALHVIVTGQPRRTAGLILVLLALGFLVFSTRLFVGLSVGVIALWAWATRAFAGSEIEPAAWSFHLSILVQSFAVAVAVHLVRLQDLVAVESRRVALEDELKRTEALLTALPDAVARVDRSGRLLSLQAAACGCGLGPDDVGLPLAASSLPAGAIAACVAALDRAFAPDAGVASFEYSVADDGSSREFEARLRQAGPDEAVLVIREVTAERRARRQRDEVIAVVAHELRSPLTGIRGTLSLLETAHELGAGERQVIALGARSTERMARLVDDLLDLELAEAGELRLRRERLDLSALARVAAETAQPAAVDRGVRVRVEAAAGLHVKGDRDRLLQVFLNLIANAARCSPAGGEVLLRVQAVPEGVRASVLDRGPGVPEDVRGRLFERFARGSERQRAGAGLGLAISRRLVLAQGGRLTYEPRPGGGACFQLTLPAAGSAERPSQLAS